VRVSGYVISAAAFAAAACGAPAGTDQKNPLNPLALSAPDQAVIVGAIQVSEAMGGCSKPAAPGREPRIVNLESGAIAMIPCNADGFAFTDRLFLLLDTRPPELLSLPDYGSTGWFASDQASMAELDAGTGTLTTMRKIDGGTACGSEGRFQWDGARFVVQELRWQACGDPNASGPPFPAIWPTMTGSTVDPGATTPAP